MKIKISVLIFLSLGLIQNVGYGSECQPGDYISTDQKSCLYQYCQDNAGADGSTGWRCRCNRGWAFVADENNTEYGKCTSPELTGGLPLCQGVGSAKSGYVLQGINGTNNYEVVTEPHANDDFRMCGNPTSLVPYIPEHTQTGFTIKLQNTLDTSFGFVRIFCDNDTGKFIALDQGNRSTLNAGETINTDAGLSIGRRSFDPCLNPKLLLQSPFNPLIYAQTCPSTYGNYGSYTLIPGNIGGGANYDLPPINPNDHLEIKIVPATCESPVAQAPVIQVKQGQSGSWHYYTAPCPAGQIRESASSCKAIAVPPAPATAPAAPVACPQGTWSYTGTKPNCAECTSLDMNATACTTRGKITACKSGFSVDTPSNTCKDASIVVTPVVPPAPPIAQVSTQVASQVASKVSQPSTQTAPITAAAKAAQTLKAEQTSAETAYNKASAAYAQAKAATTRAAANAAKTAATSALNLATTAAATAKKHKSRAAEAKANAAIATANNAIDLAKKMYKVAKK